MLSVRELSVAYGAIRALSGVSLEVRKGETVALLGANGAGKSTLLLTIAGALPAQGGEVHYAGRALPLGKGTPPAPGLRLVPERRRLFAPLSVRENLLMGAYGRSERGEIEADLAALCRQFPILGERLSQPAGTLSGGEQQMLALARGLMARPKLLLLDEPSLGLAPLICHELFATIRRLKNEGLTLILAEQNAARALELADRAYVLENGRITLEGRGRALAGDARVRAAYLGR